VVLIALQVICRWLRAVAGNREADVHVKKPKQATQTKTTMHTIAPRTVHIHIHTPLVIVSINNIQPAGQEERDYFGADEEIDWVRVTLVRRLHAVEALNLACYVVLYSDIK
jgi:hypothetical protein